MNNLTVETEDTFASLLELAANNDIEGFKKAVQQDPMSIDEVGLWYCRGKGSKQMVNEHRTPLMVAATYGSVDIIKYILSNSGADVNRICGSDNTTALHCAASGGAANAVEVVKLLLAAGANQSLVDASGHRPVDVIVVPPKLQGVKLTLKELLATEGPVIEHNVTVSTGNSNGNSPPFSASPKNGSPSAADTLSLPVMPKVIDLPVFYASEKKEYPIDPSLPDIKNSIYATDEFRMYSFKVRPCSRAYSHDWTECPFVHPGENARRRDPRKYHYSCVPCPDFRKGACRRGDMCEYAHGVFECWLHPAQYRTRLCKDGTSCSRRVCFFAHTKDELRPLYASTGSAVPSPRSSTPGATAMDFAAALSMMPGSPSSVSVMSPSTYTPPMSPSTNGMSHSWSQANVPPLQLSGSNLQSSRLRSSLNARDIPAEDYDMLSDFDVQQQKQLINEISCLSQSAMSSNNLNRPGRMKSLNPSNLDDLFSAESSSPRYTDQALAAAVFSPTHKSAVLNQFQQQQSMLSSVNSNFSSKAADHPLLQPSYGVPSSGRMSPLNVEPVSPVSRVPMFAQREQRQQFRSLSSRELGYNSGAMMGSPVSSWSKWGLSDGKPDWTVGPEEFSKLRRSSSFEIANNEEEPDLSWVQSLVKESPFEMREKEGTSASGNAKAPAPPPPEGSSNSGPIEPLDHTALGSWLENMHLDPVVARQN